jgi:hypothetical protein
MHPLTGEPPRRLDRVRRDEISPPP